MIAVLAALGAGAFGAVLRFVVARAFAARTAAGHSGASVDSAVVAPAVASTSGERLPARGRARSAAFPWAVLVVNVVGSAVGGGVLALAQAGALSADIRLVLLSGFCGGLTTFSTFSVETIELVLRRELGIAALSVAANLVAGVGAAALAWSLLSLTLQ